MSKKENLQSKAEKDLVKSINEHVETLRKFRFGVTKSNSRNVHVGKTSRRSVARMLTELNRRRMENAQ